MGNTRILVVDDDPSATMACWRATAANRSKRPSSSSGCSRRRAPYRRGAEPRPAQELGRGDDSTVGERIVDTAVRRLRRELESVEPGFDRIEAVVGAGYGWKA